MNTAPASERRGDTPRAAQYAEQQHKEVEPGAYPKRQRRGTCKRVQYVEAGRAAARTECAFQGMLEAPAECAQLDGGLATVTPDHLPGISQSLLVVGERDEVLERAYGSGRRAGREYSFARGRGQVHRTERDTLDTVQLYLKAVTRWGGR